MAPILLWQRRDLRMTDNPAMDWAAAQGQPVIPVFILDEVVQDWGAAPRWRLGQGLDAHARRLGDAGSRLVLRRGRALDVLRALIAETGAETVAWNRLYVADERARDRTAEDALRDDGVGVETFCGHVLFEPPTVQTRQGGSYRVFTPFWRAVRGRDPGTPLAPVEALAAPDEWPASDALDEWELGAAMRRGADVVARYAEVGELAARDRLVAFCDRKVATYAEARDDLGQSGTSGLSENLTYGEISARECWCAGRRVHDDGDANAETFLRELTWRDFAHHLAFHTPHLTRENWKPDWDAFPWRDDNPDAEAWRRGRTGVAVVDAAMRQLWTTGTMHNRARLIVASYLTKHLLTHWRVGCEHFAECLIDWDPANNALNWQWTAGSGPDASPFFRIFNPQTQAKRFDRDEIYRHRWVAELGDTSGDADAEGLAFFEAIPLAWGMDPSDPYLDAPIVGLKEGRERALAAYGQRREAE